VTINWTITTGPIIFSNGSTATLSVSNESDHSQSVILGIMGGGITVTIPSGGTVTQADACGHAAGCTDPLQISAATPDLIPAAVFTPTGASDPAELTAGNFIWVGDDGLPADYAADTLSGQTTAFESLGGSVNAIQALLSPAAAQITALTGNVNALGGSIGGLQSAAAGTSGQVAAVQSALPGTDAPVELQIAALAKKVDTLTTDVSKLTKLLTPKKTKKKKSSSKPKSGSH
jgi:hypothetical protein